MNKNLTFAALVVGALLVSGCGKDGKQEAPVASAPVEAVALEVPASNDSNAWKQYLVNVTKRNLEGIRSSPFMYYLPSADDPEAEDQYVRQMENVAGTVMRGVLPGNMLAFGSPSSNRMADLIVEAFQGVQAGSMREVRVLFIGKPEDLERVKAAVEPSGANVVFHEVK